MHVESTLPYKNLVGKKFWRSYRLQLDLERKSAFIDHSSKRIPGPLVDNSQEEDERAMQAVQVVIEDSDVHEAVR